MKDPYSILGVSSRASDKEIKDAYHELAKKYHPDNYDSDNPLKDLANEKMQEINWAYDEIQRMRAGGQSYQSSSYYGTNQSNTSNNPVYAEIRADINARRFADAESSLMKILPIDRVAEWHYLMSLVLMSRKNTGDAIRELEIACNMDPGNYEYQKAKEMFNTNASSYGNTYYGSYNNGRPASNRNSDACDCCANLICLDCLCECMGGDLITCC